MTAMILAERQKALLIDLKLAGIVMFGPSIKEKYGLGAPVYLDLRDNLYRRPELIWRIGAEFALKIRGLLPSTATIGRVIGVPDTATPLALAASLYSWQQGLVPALQFALLRREAKAYQYGRASLVIGDRGAELDYTLIDDVMASGLSKWKAVVKLRDEAISVSRILVFIDRQQGGAALLAKEGYDTHSVFRLMDIMDFYLEEKMITQDQYQEVGEFIANRRFDRPLWEQS